MNRLSLHISHILQAVDCSLGQQTVDVVLAWHQTDARQDHKHVCIKPLTVAVRVAECNALSRCLLMCSSNMCSCVLSVHTCLSLRSGMCGRHMLELVYIVNACGSCSSLLYETPCWQSGPITHSVLMSSRLESCQPLPRGVRSPELTECL